MTWGVHEVLLEEGERDRESEGGRAREGERGRESRREGERGHRASDVRERVCAEWFEWLDGIGVVWHEHSEAPAGALPPRGRTLVERAHLRDVSSACCDHALVLSAAHRVNSSNLNA